MNVTEQEELLRKVEEAKEQISRLREQQARLEKEKADLEDLRHKQEEWERGKKEVRDALVEAITILESEEDEAVRMHELVRATRETYGALLDEFRGVKENLWTSESLGQDLSRALVILQKAREELGKGRARIPALDADRQAEPSGAAALSAAGGVPRVDAAELLRIGFWLALPLALMLLVLILVFASL